MALSKNGQLVVMAVIALGAVYFVKKVNRGPGKATITTDSPWDISYFPNPQAPIDATARVKNYPVSLDACWSNAQNMDSGSSLVQRGGKYRARGTVC